MQDLPFHEWATPDGQPWARMYRTDEGYRIWFLNLAEFYISNDGKDIRAFPVSGVKPQTIEHLRINLVEPLALSRQMRLVLHGAAIEFGDSAIGFLGVSGRGKSTLVASYSQAHYRFLTDDGLQLELLNGGYLAKPSHPSIRLWEDSRAQLVPESVRAAPPVEYTPKSRLLAGDDICHCPESKPLKAIYFLGEGTARNVAITPVSLRNAMVELVKHSFLLDIEERQMLEHHFSQLTDLVQKIPCFELDYPRDYNWLPRVRQVILSHVEPLING